MPRLTGTRELMRFIRKTHHHCWDFTELERAKHLFTTGAGRGAVIRFAKNEHHRRLHVLDVSNGRPRFEVSFVIKRWRFEPVRLKESKVGCVPPVSPTRNVALGNGCCEARRLSHYPVREQSAATPASHAEFVL